jgi:hypothetical protein
MNYQIGVSWIIRFQMHGIVMLAIHAGMHHEDTGFDRCAATGTEYHRTDG